MRANACQPFEWHDDNRLLDVGAALAVPAPIVLAFADAVVGFGDQGTVSVAKSMCTQAL